MRNGYTTAEETARSSPRKNPPEKLFQQNRTGLCELDQTVHLIPQNGAAMDMENRVEICYCWYSGFRLLPCQLKNKRYP